MRGSISSILLSLLSISLWTTPTTAQQKCYAPNGTETNRAHGLTGADSYFSCNITRGGGIHSMCCRLGNGVGYDICLDSGLCQNSVIGSTSYWRESCTDPSWTDPGCLQLYNEGDDSSGFDLSTNDVELLRCPDGSFCSGAKNTTCCQKSQGFFVNDDGDISPATAVQSSSTVSTRTATSTKGSTSKTGSPTATGSIADSAASTPTAIQSNTTSENKGTNVPVIVGAVVGSVGGVLLLAGIVALVLCIRRRRRGTSREQQQQGQQQQQWQQGWQGQQVPPGQPPAMAQSYYGYDANKVRYGREGEGKGVGTAQVVGEQRFEMHGEGRPVELQGRFVELDAGR